ncbi:SEC-C metal-binding domain-containing protein [Rhodococcus sp. NPDC059234]|uniref:SEC-C metal-binding domain-containing protein n=1 Tax=Rhodococcus sp. NPDC059234 TaxID=3346781 RepID=UPI00367180A4
MTDPIDPRDVIADAAMSILREQGPLTAQDWGQLLADAGHGPVAEMVQLVELLDDEDVGYLPDGRTVALDSLLEGRVFTHRLTETEIAAGILDANPDLTPLTVYVLDSDQERAGQFRVVFADADEPTFADRGVDDPNFPYGEGLLLAADALSSYAAGDLVGLAVRGGQVELERVDAVEAADVSAGLGRILGDEGADNLDAVVWQLAADDPALFTRPAAPLGELIEAAGFERDGDYVAVRGFDFEAHHLATHIGMVAREHELHPDEASAVVAFLALVGQTRDVAHDGTDPGSWAREHVSSEPDRYAGLADPVAAAAALELVAGFSDRPDALYAASVALVETGPRRARASAHWLAGNAADRLGDVVAAEAHFEDAAALDDGCAPAVFALAQLASDRGDAVRGLSLLGRIEGGDAEPLYAVLQRYVPTEHPGLGRNDRCWCGSGRKYKACHLGKVDNSLDDRARWLYRKAEWFALSPELFDVTYDLAEVRAAHWDGEDAVGRAFQDPLALDVALFECGVFALYLARRGSLLPADEFELAQRWSEAKRSVFEVIAVRPQDGLTLRDERTGEVVEVLERSGSAQLAPGDFVCARVVPAGSTTQIFGGIEPVAPSSRAELLALLDAEDADPAELVEFLSERFA